MGFKTIEQHYGIKHIVSVRNEGKHGKCICIGSPYIHDIIVIRISDAKVVKRYKDGKYNDGWSINENLKRYDMEICADQETGKLRELIDRKDTFERSLPVYTICKRVVEKDYCEEYGWPNCTHSGELMYNNTYFKTRKEAYSYLLTDTRLALRYMDFRRRIGEACNKIKDIFGLLFSYLYNWTYARTIARFKTKEIHLK